MAGSVVRQTARTPLRSAPIAAGSSADRKRATSRSPERCEPTSPTWASRVDAASAPMKKPRSSGPSQRPAVALTPRKPSTATA